MFVSGLGTITEMHAIFYDGDRPTMDEMSEYALLNSSHASRGQ